jgi:hypothetical protein
MSHFGVFYPRGGGRHLIEIIYLVSLIISSSDQQKNLQSFIRSWKLKVGTGRGLSDISVASLLMVGSGIQELMGSGVQGFGGGTGSDFRLKK